MELPRLSGSGGLAAAVNAALESGAASRTLLVFDFDRTLTNGISRPGDEIAKVVRGGEATVAALRRAHDAGAELFIVTARRPARLSVEQLFASLDNAQSALSPFFPRGDCVEFRFGNRGGVPLARGGRGRRDGASVPRGCATDPNGGRSPSRRPGRDRRGGCRQRGRAGEAAIAR